MALLGPPARAALVVAAAFALPGCAQTLGFSECGATASPDDIRAGKADGDCSHFSSDAGAAYCTTQHFCVSPLPSERLCAGSYGAAPAPGNLVLASLVDRNDPIDKNVERAFELALDEINMRQKGASQPPLELHLCDTASDPDQALRAARFAYDHFHPSAFLGPSTSGAVVNVTAFIKQQGILVVSPSATAIDITYLKDDNLVWRTAPSDALQAVLLAKVVKLDLPAPTSVASLFVNSVYGKGLSDAFVSEYGKATANSMKVSPTVPFTGLSDLPAGLNKIAGAIPTPSHALLVADNDAPALVAMLRSQHGLDSTEFFMTDAAMTDAIFGTPAQPVDKTVLGRIRGTAPAIPMGGDFDSFRSSFKSKFSVDPGQSAFAANAYDAAYLVAIAAAATSGHVPTGGELAKGLARIKAGCDHTAQGLFFGGSAYLTVLQKIAAGPVCLNGASGPLEFDGNGDPVFGSFEYWAIDTNGKPAFKQLLIPKQ